MEQTRANFGHAAGRGDDARTGGTTLAPITNHVKTPDIPASKTPSAPRDADTWYYPTDIADDLKDIDLPPKFKAEILACAWEYARCCAPSATNWNRHIAFMRIMVMCIIAEFRGSLVDISVSDDILSYNVSAILKAQFEGTPGYVDMACEYRAFLLIAADKTSDRRDGELFRRYVNALAQSPRQWFRMRDCDGLVRFTIACVLACNDQNDIWFTDNQFEILAEIGITLYDAVGFYKHRTEGETNSTFAYMPEDLRAKGYQQARDILWALDVAWARKPKLQAVIHFLRILGGPIHMMMRRYRFVEDDLMIGKPETDEVIDQTRRHFKLWNRVDANTSKRTVQSTQRYQDLIARSDELMFPGLAEFLETGGDGYCNSCLYRTSYGAQTSHEFGGVKLCECCKAKWREYLESFHERARNVFPEILSVEAALR